MDLFVSGWCVSFSSICLFLNFRRGKHSKPDTSGPLAAAYDPVPFMPTLVAMHYDHALLQAHSLFLSIPPDCCGACWLVWVVRRSRCVYYRLTELGSCCCCWNWWWRWWCSWQVTDDVKDCHHWHCCSFRFMQICMWIIRLLSSCQSSAKQLFNGHSTTQCYRNASHRTQPHCRYSSIMHHKCAGSIDELTRLCLLNHAGFYCAMAPDDGWQCRVRTGRWSCRDSYTDCGWAKASEGKEGRSVALT